MAVLCTALVVVLLALVVPLCAVYRPPALAIRYLQHRFPDVLFQRDCSRKVVALTIDDAPSGHTRAVLDVLREHGASATFFVIGNQVAGRERVLADIVRAGSELGNHALRDEPSVKLASATLAHHIDRVDADIERAYHAAGRPRPARYFRPGSGVFSARILAVAAAARYQTVLGSIYPHDPFIPYPRVNAWHILSMLRPGAVIICHDRRSWTVPMLRTLIPQIQARGYQVVSVSKFLELAKP